MISFNKKAAPLGPYSEEIDATTEVALQRAMIIDQYPGGSIVWDDIELPVDSKSDHRADLIGHMGNTMVLCELKFFTQNSLQETMDEVMCNFRLAIENADYLERENRHHENGNHFDWRNFKVMAEPMIAADHGTIERWGIDVDDYFARHEFRIIDLGDIPEDYFEKQKGTKTKYTPHIRKSDIKSL